MAGTIVGAGLATLLVSVLRPGPITLIILIVIFSWLCYSTVTVGYGVLSASVTAYIALLFALGGLPETDVALHRVANTCLGGALALLTSIISQHFRQSAGSESLGRSSMIDAITSMVYFR